MCIDTNCIFCKVVNGQESSSKVWEDQKHLAFLSTNPNTEGLTVLVTKDHYPSDVTKLTDKVYTDLMLAAKEVAKLLTTAFGIERTGIVAEGYGVNHAHLKLIPFHGTVPGTWEAKSAPVGEYVEL